MLSVSFKCCSLTQKHIEFCFNIPTRLTLSQSRIITTTSRYLFEWMEIWSDPKWISCSRMDISCLFRRRIQIIGLFRMEGEVEFKSKAVSLLVDRGSYSHLSLQTVCRGWKNKITDPCLPWEIRWRALLLMGSSGSVLGLLGGLLKVLSD